MVNIQKEFQDLKEKIVTCIGQEIPSMLHDKNELYAELKDLQTELIEKNNFLLGILLQTTCNQENFLVYVKQVKENWQLIDLLFKKLQEVYREYNHNSLSLENE